MTCLFTRAGFRRSGVSGALATATVDFARRSGAKAIEAYPITTTKVIEEELHAGTCTTFAAPGVRRGQPADAAAGGDAHRLLTGALQTDATARSIRDAEADGLRPIGLSYLRTYGATWSARPFHPHDPSRNSGSIESRDSPGAIEL